MFADEQLASAIQNAWRINLRDDFHFDLLRLIREGGIKGAASLAKTVALDQNADDYHRIVAVQAAGACGDSPTLTAIAKALLKKPELASPKLAPALSLVLYPQYLSTQDLLKAIEKSQQPGRYSAEGFGYQLQQFYDQAPDAAARKTFLGGLADLCLSKPFTDDFHRIANRFEDIAKHLHDLTRNEALQLGDKRPPDYLIRLLMVVERAGREGFTKEAKPQLYELVRGNPKLNRALFWADVAEQRANGRHGPVVNHWQVHFSGHATLWNFSEPDLGWLNDDLASRSALEDKQVVLSAILQVLHRAGRLLAEETRLRTVIGSEPILLTHLGSVLSPPPETPDMMAHRIRSEAYALKEKAQRIKNQEAWIKFRNDLLNNPSILSNPANLKSWKAGIFRLHYLSNWLHERTGSDVPRAAIEWRLLAEGFNRPVAEAYRNGITGAWRSITPVRPIRTSGSGITTQVTTILAFSGVGVEAADDADWTLKLSEQEAVLAARHGCRAEQNYPEWLNQLIMSCPKAVLPVVKEEIDHEWTTATEGQSIFLHQYGAAAHPIPQPVQRLVLSAMLKSDAKTVAILRTGLRIVRNLELNAKDRAQLFATAKARYTAHVKAKLAGFALSYLGLLLMLDPDASLSILRNWLNAGPKFSRQERAETTFSTLFDRYDPILSISLANASTKTLEELLHLAYSHIRPKDDAVHQGSFSPDARGHAESARNAILSTLLDRPGADAYHAMKRLADDPIFELRSHRFHELAREKAERDTEGPAWSATEALTFHREGISPAKTGADLLRIVVGVLSDIGQNLTHGDVTSRPLLERAKDEDEVQNWLVEQMNARARGRFHAFREPEVAGGDKPDVIVASTSSPYEVAIEVKHGGMGWTARQLEYALRTQLAEDYLKPASRRHGVLVITHHRDRRWLDVADKKPLSFAELIAWLSGTAKIIRENTVGSIAISCVGINAWKEDSTSALPERVETKRRAPAKRRSTCQKASKRKKSAMKRR